MKPIRTAEITQIKALMGEGMKQSQIARTLNLNRLSVRRTMAKIENGEVLKYENSLPVLNYSKRPSVIQGDEIRRIRQLLSDGYNAYQISNHLQRPYSSVRGYVKKIEQGKELKFETLIPQNQRFNGGMYYH